MTHMVDIENFWLVMAIDPADIEGMVDLIAGFEEHEEPLKDFPVNLVGMTISTVEAMHAEMAIVYPNWEVIGAWRLSGLMTKPVDKLTAI